MSSTPNLVMSNIWARNALRRLGVSIKGNRAKNGFPGCGFSPAKVTPNSSTVTTTLTITAAAHTASLAPPAFGHRSSPLYAMWLVPPTMLLGTMGLATPKRRKLLSYALVCLLAGSCLLQAACGGASNSGSSGGSGGAAGGTPRGSLRARLLYRCRAHADFHFHA